jgi:hypothetical protein
MNCRGAPPELVGSVVRSEEESFGEESLGESRSRRSNEPLEDGEVLEEGDEDGERKRRGEKVKEKEEDGEKKSQPAGVR